MKPHKFLNKFLKVEKPPYHTTHNLKSIEADVLQRGILFYPESVHGYKYSEVYPENQCNWSYRADIAPSWSTQGVEFFHMQNCLVDSRSGVVFHPKTGRYLVDFSWGWGKPRSFREPKFSANKIAELNIGGPIYCLAGKGYHGVIEEIPIIFMLLRKFPDLYVLIRSSNLWVRNLAITLGFPEDKLIMCDEKWLTNKDIIAVTKSAFGEFVNPGLIRTLRELGSRIRIPSRKISDHDALYISREHVPARGVLREREIRKTLENLGFLSVSLESMAIEEQIYALSRARILVGFHGAGFVNMAFCRNQAKVFELYSAGGLNSCYSSMAAVLGHEYGNHCFDGNITRLVEALNGFSMLDADRSRLMTAGLDSENA